MSQKIKKPHRIRSRADVICLVLLYLSSTAIGQPTSDTSSQKRQCSPACERGLCRQAVNSAALYCDCSGTGYKGPTCAQAQAQNSSTSSASVPSGTPSTCSPACQHGICRQAVNSQTFYCDCSGSGYYGATCSQQMSPSQILTASPSPSAVPSTCSPVCQNGRCKQAVNSGAFYCDCSDTNFTGLTCSQHPSPVPSQTQNSTGSRQVF